MNAAGSRKLWQHVEDRWNATRLYAWLGGLSLFFLVFLTPPFQVPDELQHFYRSYQLSQLDVRSRVQDGAAGAQLPASLPELVQEFLGTTELHTGREISPRSWRSTLAELKRPLDAGRTVFVPFSGGAFYAPLPYIPQALAIAAGRTLDIGPLGLLYLGRLANALAAALVTGLALSLFPVGRTFALVVALLPMTQFMTASLSPDALTIAGALLSTALLARFLTTGKWSVPQQLLAIAAGLLMCMVKIVYLPLTVIGLGAAFGKGRLAEPAIRRALVIQLVGAAAIAAVCAWWFLSNPGGVKHTRTGVDPAAQLSYLAQHPVDVFRIVARQLYLEGDFLAKSAIGLLGWLNLPLASWVYWAVALAFPLSLYAEPRPAGVGTWTVAWLAVAGSCAVLLIVLALYVAWTPVGAYTALGVQGRYFTPILPAVGVGLAALLSRLPRGLVPQAYAGVAALLFAATAAMHFTLVTAYGLF